MKFLILLSFVAFAAAVEMKLTDEQKAKAREHAQLCIKQEGITKEQAQALREGKFSDQDDAKVKCFANCFLEQAGLFVDGQLKPDVVLEKLSPIAGVDNVKATQSKCDSIKGADKCDTAYQLYKCYHMNKSEL